MALSDNEKSELRDIVYSELQDNLDFAEQLHSLEVKFKYGIGIAIVLSLAGTALANNVLALNEITKSLDEQVSTLELKTDSLENLISEFNLENDIANNHKADSIQELIIQDEKNKK